MFFLLVPEVSEALWQVSMKAGWPASTAEQRGKEEPALSGKESQQGTSNSSWEPSSQERIMLQQPNTSFGQDPNVRAAEAHSVPAVFARPPSRARHPARWPTPMTGPGERWSWWMFGFLGLSTQMFLVQWWSLVFACVLSYEASSGLAGGCKKLSCSWWSFNQCLRSTPCLFFYSILSYFHYAVARATYK